MPKPSTPATSPPTQVGNILLDRGLDIFPRYEMNDAFALGNRVQQYRPVKAFEVTYLKK